jgi:hypothetical protein
MEWFPMMMNKKADEHYSEQETVARRDAVLKRMLATPPKPHSEMKIGKSRTTKRRIRSKKEAKSDD